MKRKTLRSLFIFLSITVILVYPEGLVAQSLVQTIRGVVIDMDSQIALAGATVMIMDSNPVTGTVTDNTGSFRLSGIKTGRYNIQVSFLGYETAILSEILVESGKETSLHVELKESAMAISQVEVKAFANKEHAVNPMAMISSRQLTMEEASRYAGGIDDPSRLASAFAGVAGSLSSNAIVIRGNAPKGLLWRMEGIEIPNPSHFANVSTFGGGGITALSSQMLSNSDFFTGAFPSEYGNALSGVFDMKIRTGNNEKREHTVKAGIIGIDFATEGPFVIGKRSSYLINYRYSTLALISPLLPENAQGLKYQDLSYKLNFPFGKHGTLSTWALFSTDRTGSKAEKDSSLRQYYQDIEEDKNVNRMGALGLSYKAILSENTYINTSLAATGNYIFWRRDRLNDSEVLYPRDEILQNDRKYTFSFLLNNKFGPKHTNRSGVTINSLSYHVILRQNLHESGSLATFANEKGSSFLIQFYSQSRMVIGPRLSANAGFHTQWLALNQDISIEPRASVKYKLSDRQFLSLAYGLHSRIEPIGFYFARQETNGKILEPNRNLALTKAHHMVLSYEISTGKNSRLLIEPFYQKLYNVPVIPDSSFSMLNLEMDWFFNDSLINKGTGYNAGIDFTLERFLNSGYYYLITGSLFDSKYKAGDGIERNARFNKNYVVNFLFGKEWMAGKGKSSILGLNWKFSLLGGDRITPVNHQASRLVRDVVYDESHAFEKQKPDVYYVDFTASWKKNKARYSRTWSIQFVNLLFQKEFYGYRYNFKTGNVEPLKETVVIPNISYRIDF